MKRRGRHPGQPRENPISLFPFLAVLICTMGVLILLLVILVQQARMKALAEARSGASEAAQELPSAEELQRVAEDIEWQMEQLRSSRERTQQQLAEARVVLGHLEDSLRRLRQEVETWRNKLAELGAGKGMDHARHETARRVQEAELEALRQRIAELKKQVLEAEKRPAKRSYAIIPYQGPHGTNRRPIYLECRADGVYLQPEGIRFTPADFSTSLGPGNPLDAALRAVREEWLARGQFDPLKDGEPYPLLIVRPSGIEAYYAARAAMTSWGAEFGYELIEEDWKLSYPPPDPALAKTVEQAVALARRRQEFLAQSAPGRFGRSRLYRPAPYVGGAVEEPSEPFAGSPSHDPMLARWQTKIRSASANPKSASDEPGQAVPGVDFCPGAPSEAVAQTSGAEVSASEGASGMEGTSFAPQISQAGNRPAPSGLNAPSGVSVSPSGRPEDSASPGEARTGDAFLSLRPLADRHGKNWGLMTHDRDAIPVTRPIRVECFADRLVLVPDDRRAGVRVFPLNDPEQAVEQLVATIKDWITSWGMAGRGMYWRPILRVHVSPGGERTFHLLSTLLADSGLIVERAPPP